MTKLQAHLFVTDTVPAAHLDFAGVKVQVTVQDVPHTAVRHAQSLSMLTSSECGRQTPTQEQIFSGVRIEQCRPDGFLQVTELSSRHCLTHRRIVLAEWASRRLVSGRNPRCDSVMDLVRMRISTAHTLPQCPTLRGKLNRKLLLHIRHTYSIIP
jgi:hypothetical protein